MQPLSDLEALHNELKQPGDFTPSPLHSPGHKLKFFKKHGNKGEATPVPVRSPDDYFEAKPMNGDLLMKQHGQALASLRQQHDALVAALRAFPQHASQAALHSPALPPPHSMSFDGNRPLSTYASRSSAAFHRSTPSRASSFSIASGETGDFYDALPGEFMLEEEDKSSGEEEDVEEEEGPGESGFIGFGGGGDDRSSAESESGEVERMPPEPVGAVHRRTRLPSPVTGDEFSMLGLLRKNVGKVRFRRLGMPLTTVAEHWSHCRTFRPSRSP